MIKKMLVGYIQDGRHSGIDKYLLGFIKVAHENGVILDLLTDKVTPYMSEYLRELGMVCLKYRALKNRRHSIGS